MNKSGKRKVMKAVRGKHGTVMRSYWVKSGDVLKRHGGKIVAGAALAGAAYMAHKHRHFLGGAGHGLIKSLAVQREHNAHSAKKLEGAKLARDKKELQKKGQANRIGIRDMLRGAFETAKMAGAEGAKNKDYGRSFKISMRHKDGTRFKR